MRGGALSERREQEEEEESPMAERFGAAQALEKRLSLMEHRQLALLAPLRAMKC